MDANEPLVQIALHFVCARGLFSWAIARWGAQKPEFSHVDVVLPDGRYLGARDDKAGGMPPGVWIRPSTPPYAKWVRSATVSFSVPASKARAALEWADGEIGSRYDEDAIWGFILGQRWHRNGSFICSVFAGNYLLQAGVIEEAPENLQGTSPNELYAIALAEGGRVIGS